MGIALVLVFAFVCVSVLAVGSMGERAPVAKRLIRLADRSVGAIDQPAASESFQRDGSSRWLRFIEPLIKASVAGDDLKSAPTRARLVEGGFRRPNALAVYMSVRIVLAIVLPTVFLVMSPMFNLDQFQFMVTLVASVVAGFILPSYWVDTQRTKRKKLLVCGLPDALDLMVVCVEAGLGINASLVRISKEFARTNPILSAEFELVTLEIRAGKSNIEALRSLASRSGVSEVASLVAMLVQTERFGTSLAETLRIHADSLRVQRLQRAEELAGKAPLKMMFPTMLIFVATLLVTIGPGMLQLIGFFTKLN
jgi:tight adherence protein C